MISLVPPPITMTLFLKYASGAEYGGADASLAISATALMAEPSSAKIVSETQSGPGLQLDMRTELQETCFC